MLVLIFFILQYLAKFKNITIWSLRLTQFLLKPMGPQQQTHFFKLNNSHSFILAWDLTINKELTYTQLGLERLWSLLHFECPQWTLPSKNRCTIRQPFWGYWQLLSMCLLTEAFWFYLQTWAAHHHLSAKLYWNNNKKLNN